MAPPPVGHQ
jgi:hypothetical protein